MKEPAIFIKLSSYLIPMMIETFLPCYFGNDVMIASLKLSEGLFHSNWIDIDDKFKTAMKIFIENTKKPLKILAFGIFVVNLSTFTSIFNLAYTFYAVLGSVNK